MRRAGTGGSVPVPAHFCRFAAFPAEEGSPRRDQRWSVRASSPRLERRGQCGETTAASAPSDLHVGSATRRDQYLSRAPRTVVRPWATLLPLASVRWLLVRLSTRKKTVNAFPTSCWARKFHFQCVGNSV